MMLKKQPLLILFLSFIVFIYTYVLLQYYTMGDQEVYIKAYEMIKEVSSIKASYMLYHNITGGAEPVSFLLFYLFSYLSIPKILFSTMTNAVLAYLTFKLLWRWRTAYFVSILLVFTNFYFLVLYTAAERLKISFIFMLFYLLYKKRLFLILTILAHFQWFILFISVMVAEDFRILKRMVANKILPYKGLVFNLVSILFGGIIIILFYERIYEKVSFYLNYQSHNPIKLFLFYFLTIYYNSKLKLQKQSYVTIIFITLSFFILIVGDTRINLFGYFIFLYFALQYNRGINFGILLTSFYFFIKSLFFVYNIIYFHNGFAL